MTIARWLAPIVLTLFFFVCVSGPGFTADHEDGRDVRENHPQADILDFFAFSNADRSRLVLAMTLHSDAPENAAFDTDTEFRFRLRESVVNAEGSGRARRVSLSAGDEEDVIVCQATGPDEGGQTVTCSLNPTSCDDNCLTSEVAVDAIAPGNPDGLRVFAGRVRDPFFSDVFSRSTEATPGPQ